LAAQLGAVLFGQDGSDDRVLQHGDPSVPYKFSCHGR